MSEKCSRCGKEHNENQTCLEAAKARHCNTIESQNDRHALTDLELLDIRLDQQNQLLNKLTAQMVKVQSQTIAGIIELNKNLTQSAAAQEAQFLFDQNKDKMRIWVSFVNTCLSCEGITSENAMDAADRCIEGLELRFKI